MRTCLRNWVQLRLFDHLQRRLQHNLQQHVQKRLLVLFRVFRLRLGVRKQLHFLLWNLLRLHIMLRNMLWNLQGRVQHHLQHNLQERLHVMHVLLGPMHKLLRKLPRVLQRLLPGGVRQRLHSFKPKHGDRKPREQHQARAGHKAL